MTDKKRLNPYRLLAGLPAVIETRHVRLAADWEKKAANEALSRWTKAGLVSVFAKEIFFNLVSTPDAPQTHVYEAADRTLRRGMVLVGASALNKAGWTTQMPAGRELAIITDRNVRTWKRMAGITAEARSVGWFGSVKDHTIQGEGDFDTLPPALALVDTIASAERFSRLSPEAQDLHRETGSVNWHPDADDICIPVDKDPEEAWQEIVSAAEILGVSYESIRDYAIGIPDLEDVVSASSCLEPKPPRY